MCARWNLHSHGMFIFTWVVSIHGTLRGTDLGMGCMPAFDALPARRLESHHDEPREKLTALNLAEVRTFEKLTDTNTIATAPYTST
mmetsp:Transcript_13951/g.36055  ORF Transcript_13951/g.36055 Transcript_13951/m.36055 type:complete len:86 (-) Transcript_13951:49-306(-)